jgi:hypothetical protein
MVLQLESSFVGGEVSQDLCWTEILLRWSVVWAKVITTELFVVLVSGDNFQHDEAIAPVFFFKGWILHCLANWEMPSNVDPIFLASH